MQLKELINQWSAVLKPMYIEREVKNMLLVILEDLLGFSRSQLLIHQTDLTQDQLLQLDEVLARLNQGEPLQHIIGFTYFDDLKIEVSPAVLIPRPETEELVHWIAETVKFSNLSILDCCTGSGCIALALANRFPQALVSGIDVSSEALQVARRNASQLELSVRFEKLDLLTTNPSQTDLDIIVSNPPYIPQSELQNMHVNVTEFEPSLALFVTDNDPLMFYRQISEYAFNALKKGGLLFYELHENFAFETQELIQSLGFSHVELKQDLQGKWRMLKAEK